MISLFLALQLRLKWHSAKCLLEWQDAVVAVGDQEEISAVAVAVVAEALVAEDVVVEEEGAVAMVVAAIGLAQIQGKKSLHQLGVIDHIC